LADVKTFLDEVPRVPKSAYKDLKDAELSDLDSETSSESPFPSFSSRLNLLSSGRSSPMARANTVANAPSSTLVPMFNQPGGFANFFDLLRERKVCLENAFMSDCKSVRGTIRVQNVGFHKSVSLMYTTNEWARQTELEAEYLQGSCDGYSDKFTFFLSVAQPSVGQRLQFCIRYTVNDQKYWDNNEGRNYVFQCTGMTAGTSGSRPSSSAAPIPQARSSSHSIAHSPSAMSEEPWLRYL